MDVYLLESFNIWRRILQKVDPSELLFESIRLLDDADELRIDSTAISLAGHPRIYVSGAGKASAGMALGIERRLGDRLTDGMVISSPNPYHHPKVTRVLTGSHPYPDRKSFEATNQLLEYIREIPPKSLLINLISGGTSSLLCCPVPSIPEEDISQLYRQLVTSGARIDQINTVRKAVSSVKGGKMLDFMKHVSPVDLIISDVPDDDIRNVGSGPTTPQVISHRDAKRILTELSLWKKIPESVNRYIDKEAQKDAAAASDPDHHPQFILSSARLVAEEARMQLEKQGYKATLESDPWSGSIDDFESRIRQQLKTMLAQKETPAAHVFYGECTLEVTGSGLGGRNQEVALRMARHLSNFEQKILFLSAGTDGIDGPTDAAGAVVDESTWDDGRIEGREPEPALSNNDSYHFFKNTPWHIITGPTGNNVMDIQLLMIP